MTCVFLVACLCMSLMCDFFKDLSDIFSQEFDKCTKQN